MGLEDVPEPTATAEDEVLVSIEAVGLNFPDYLICRGEYQEQPPFPFTVGLEAAGTVLEAGAAAKVKPGARVIATPPLPEGALAERVKLPSSRVYEIPDTLSGPAAAGLHLVYQTAYFALHDRAQLQPDETVLIHGGAGGVGTAAIQLAVAAGGRVIATASTREKRALCRDLGAEVVLEHTGGNFIDEVKQATDGRGADVVFDPVGGEAFEASCRCVAFEGRIVTIGFASGKIPTMRVNHALIKNYAVIGLHWGLYHRHNPERIREVHDELMRLASDGQIEPYVGRVVPFDDAPTGIEVIANRHALGKVVVSLS